MHGVCSLNHNVQACEMPAIHSAMLSLESTIVANLAAGCAAMHHNGRLQGLTRSWAHTLKTK